MKYNYKTGSVYMVCFDDHVEDSEDTYNFTVYGRCEKATKKHIVLSSWHYTEGDFEGDSNEKYWSILRGAVTFAEELR